MHVLLVSNIANLKTILRCFFLSQVCMSPEKYKMNSSRLSSDTQVSILYHSVVDWLCRARNWHPERWNSCAVFLNTFAAKFDTAYRIIADVRLYGQPGIHQKVLLHNTGFLQCLINHIENLTNQAWWSAYHGIQIVMLSSKSWSIIARNFILRSLSKSFGIVTISEFCR